MKRPFTEDEYNIHALNHIVLIADPDEKKRLLVGGIAIANGFRYRMTTCASETWQELNNASHMYDMLITGIKMPDRHGEVLDQPVEGEEGLSLIRMINHSQKLSGLDVVVLSEEEFRVMVGGLGRIFAGSRLYLLNELLREKSGLYK